MRVMAALLTLVVCACGGEAPLHDYPEEARAEFAASCPIDDPVCACTWDELRQALSYEEYQAALDEFRREGTMDTRVTRARTECLHLAKRS